MTAATAHLPSTGAPSPLSLLASIGRLHIVAIAALGTLTFGWLFTGERPWLLAAVVAVDWFIVNLLNRVVDLPEDRLNRIVGTEFVGRHRRAVIAVGVGLLLASLPAVHLLLPAITPWRLGYHLLGVAYNRPLLPGMPRLKTIYFLKNSASALGFVITLFAYPLATAYATGRLPPAGVNSTTLAWTLAFFVTFELSYEVIYDLRDIDGDRQAGVATYGAVHGPRVAQLIAETLAAAAFSIALIGWLTGALPWRIAIMAAAPIAQVILVRRFLRRGLRAADCIHLTWLGASLLAIYNLWVALELPGFAA